MTVELNLICNFVGACCLQPPLLGPKSFSHSGFESVVELVDHDGGIVTLPCDHRVNNYVILLWLFISYSLLLPVISLAYFEHVICFIYFLDIFDCIEFFEVQV